MEAIYMKEEMIYICFTSLLSLHNVSTQPLKDDKKPRLVQATKYFC